VREIADPASEVGVSAGGQDSDDMSLVTVGYEKVYDADGAANVKLVVNVPRYKYPSFPLKLRKLNEEESLSCIIANNTVKYSKIKEFICAKEKISVEQNLPDFWNRTMRKGYPTEEHPIRTAGKKDIRHIVSIVEDGEIRDQYVTTTRVVGNKTVKLSGSKQETRYQSLILCSFQDTNGPQSLFMLYSTERCYLCNEVAKRLGGSRVRRTRGYTLPEQWMFETIDQSVAFFCIASALSRGNKSLISDIRKTAAKPHNRAKQWEDIRVSEMNDKNRQKYFDRKQREEPRDTLQITGLMRKTGKNEIAYMHIVTKSDDASYMVLALPDRRTTESWKARGRQPKPSDPGNFDNRTLLIDLKTVVSYNVSADLTLQLQPESYEHRHNYNRHNRNVDESSIDDTDGNTGDEDSDDENNTDKSSSSSDSDTSDGAQSRFSNLLTAEDSVPVQIMARTRYSGTLQSDDDDDESTTDRSRKRKIVARDQQSTSTSSSTTGEYGLRSVFRRIGQTVTNMRKQLR